MARVTVVQVIYNHKRFIEPVFSAIFAQTYKDVHVVAVISGNEDGGKEFLQEKFPQVEVIDPGYNIGFAAGHNLVFEKYDSEFFQLVNPDLILDPKYIENIIKAFQDEKVGSATGKLYQIERSVIEFADTKVTFAQRKGDLCVLDTTGVIISKSGRARDRGQHEVDTGQYDSLTNVQAVSGAGPMYRKTALEAVKAQVSRHKRQEKQGSQLVTNHLSLVTRYEYFDEDFHSYWEDVDLSWRLSNAGWKNVFVPSAVGYHGRGAGSSEGGYKDVVGFIRHHKKLPAYVRKLNYKNHILMYIKNSPWLYPQFFVREFFMFLYILFFEIGTLAVIPEILRLLPKMWKKRKLTSGK